MLERPLTLFRSQRVVAELLVTGPKRLGVDDRRDDASVVIDRAELRLILEIALAQVEHLLLEDLADLEIRARRKDRDREIALGRRARRPHVFLGTAPDVAD